MSHSIKIRKGVNIPLNGKAKKEVKELTDSAYYAIKPSDFPGLTPKLLVKQGAKVKAGTPLFYSKENDKIVFCSPVSGEVSEIVRGEKRRILRVIIKSDKQNEAENFGTISLDSAKREEVLSKILSSGLWPLFVQRPFDIIANPHDKPKAIFVTGFDSSPLAPETSVLIDGKSAEIEAGLKALVKLADGVKVHLNMYEGDNSYSGNVAGVTTNKFSGPHPAGNVGVQIHHIDPINAEEVVWTMKIQDVIQIGGTLMTGRYNANKTIAFVGSEVKDPCYYTIKQGAQLSSLIDGNISDKNVRVISGNILTGTRTKKDGFLGFYHQQVTIEEEGDQAQFFLTEGWLAPGFKKFSLSRTFPSWLMKNKKYSLNTNLNGEERAFVFSGQYESVFPFDIYPVHLLKSVLANDIERMEQLGIYEVAPEDFALCEYVCTSKINSQDIIREGLNHLKNEL